MTKDVTRAARTGGLASRRAEWLARDLLVLDEAHGLRGQRRTQAEAAALLEGLLGRGTRVLVLSRHAPQALHAADPRLLSWYLSGMVVGLGEPDTTAREAVLGAIAATLEVPVDPEVVGALAQDRGARRQCNQACESGRSECAIRHGALRKRTPLRRCWPQGPCHQEGPLPETFS